MKPTIENLLREVTLYPEMRRNLLVKFRDHAIGNKFRELAGMLIDTDYDFTIKILALFKKYDIEQVETLFSLAESAPQCILELSDGRHGTIAGEYQGRILFKFIGAKELEPVDGSMTARVVF
jgi:hypothetical protein